MANLTTPDLLAQLRKRLFRDLEKPEHIKAAEEIMETVESLLVTHKRNEPKA